MTRYYDGSDGATYADTDIWERLESGAWTVCCYDAETGQEWMTTADGRLLHLDPVPDAVDEQARPSGPSDR